MKIGLKTNILHTILFLSIIGYLGNVIAQNRTTDISQIKYFYQELRFEEAIKFGQSILQEENTLSDQHLEYIHQYMAFSFYNIGEIDSARIHFLSLLSITPEKKLDPLQTSPKIIDFFNQTKTNFQEISENKHIISFPEYIFIEDKRPNAAWRSLILPGWGQFYKGQPTRGYIYGGSFLTSAVVLAISVWKENKYKDSYLTSTNPEEITNYYDIYNNWSKVRQVSTYSTIAIWLLSFADALWSEYPKIEVGLIGNINSDVSFLSFTYHF